MPPKKNNRLTSVKVNRKKVKDPELSGFFRLMLEELDQNQMSMTGAPIYSPSVCNVCHILPKRIYKSVSKCRDNILFLQDSEHDTFDMYLDRFDFDKLEQHFPFVWKYAVNKVLDMEKAGMIKERGRLIIEILDRYGRGGD